MKTLSLCLVLVMGSLIVGCASPLPRYENAGSKDAARVLSARASGLESITAECDVSLSGGEGRRVRLDGAMVAQPGRLRLSLWKFNQAALDLIVRDDGAWILESARAQESIDGSSRPAAWPVISWDILSGRFVRDPAGRWEDDAADADWLVWTGPAADLGMVRAWIDRRTLTVRRIEPAQADDGPAMHVELGSYRMIDSHVLPASIEIESADDAGPESVRVRLRGVTANDRIAAGVFEPGPKWRKLGEP